MTGLGFDLYPTSNYSANKWHRYFHPYELDATGDSHWHDGENDAQPSKKKK